MVVDFSNGSLARRCFKGPSISTVEIHLKTPTDLFIYRKKEDTYGTPTRPVSDTPRTQTGHV
ncbi:hypothetical protein MARINON1_51527 [Marinobacter salarius]|nr:hypothetical protein MBHK15_130084 [Marinobacter salarius]VXB88366.1 hypothetical protein MARINON1_51527 [Marinobacter salarius]